MPIATLSPEAVIGLFDQLDDSQKNDFFEMFAKRCNVVAALRIIDSLPKQQQIELNGKLTCATQEMLLPLCMKAAWEQFLESPFETFENIRGSIEEKVKQIVESAAVVGGEIQIEKYKAKRDRKTDPETIKRNNEILDLIESNASLKNAAIAKRFGLTDTYIRKVKREKSKWRSISKNRTN